MKKINLGQTIAILANVGVIAGIVFLGVELQQNNRLLEAESRYNHVSGRLRHAYTIVDNSEMAEIVSKARDNQPLETLEARRLEQWVRNLYIQWEWEYRETLVGNLNLSDLPVEGWRQAFHGRVPMAQQVWESFKPGASSEFIGFMEQAVVPIEP